MQVLDATKLVRKSLRTNGYKKIRTDKLKDARSITAVKLPEDGYNMLSIIHISSVLNNKHIMHRIRTTDDEIIIELANNQ